MDPSEPANDGINAQLAELSPLTKDLARSVTCPICLDYIDNAQQLHCGHIFCAECVSRILRMPKARCAICKRRTTKRNIRVAPVNFTEIVACLRELELIVRESAPDRRKDNGSLGLNDGFAANTGRDLTTRRVSGAGPVYARSPPKQSSSLNPVLPNRAASRRKAESSIKVNPGKDGCILCPNPGVVDCDNIVEYGKLGPVVDAAARGKGFHVHELCALYSVNAYEVDEEFWGVMRALRNTRDVVCSRAGCSAPNPTSVCAKEGCNKAYHYSCGVLDGVKCVLDGFKVFCQEHEGDAPVIDEDKFQMSLADPTGTECLEHENLCWLCHTGGRLLLCDSCPRVVHPACGGLKSIPIGEYHCAHCMTGAVESPEDSDCTPNSTPEEQAGFVRQSKKRLPGRRPSIGKAGTGKGTKRARVSLVSDKETGDEIWRPVLCSTGLDEGQRDLLKGVAGTKRTPIRHEFDSKVTHMIVNAFTPEDVPRRTMKLCKAIASGVKLVCFKWVEDGLGVHAWPDLESYVHPWSRNIETDGALFADCRFYFGSLRSVTPNKDELIAIVKLGGGVILNREPSIDIAPCALKLYVIQELAKKRSSGRRNSNVFLADSIPGAEVVEPSWILDRCTPASVQSRQR